MDEQMRQLYTAKSKEQRLMKAISAFSTAQGAPIQPDFTVAIHPGALPLADAAEATWASWLLQLHNWQEIGKEVS